MNQVAESTGFFVFYSLAFQQHIFSKSVDVKKQLVYKKFLYTL
jgi:hypothetical protein